MSLYPYQEQAVEQIRSHYRKGTKKVLLHLATGAGKTHIFSHIIQQTVANGKRAMMVVRGRELVKQASNRLDRESVDHGVMMANHWRVKPLYPVQVCSIDTLYARKIVPQADLVVIDEAHMATSDGYMWLAEQMPNAFFLPVTATPYVGKSLKHVAEVTVHPITMRELIGLGFLVPCRHYAPHKPNLKGVKTKSGDYDPIELEKRMDVLTGDIVDHWTKHAENRPTICFAINISHSHSILEKLTKAGIPCEHMDANTPDNEREEIFERLRSGETKIITNVGILGVGVDLPLVSCIIMARPTKSYNLYIQQAGRGTRIFKGKTDFILLDHAGNADRHGLIDEEREVDLDGKLTGTKPKTCKTCFMVYASRYCPTCGPQAYDDEEEIKASKELVMVDGSLVEILNTPLEVKVTRFIDESKKTAKSKGYKRGWVYYKVKDKFGDEVADKFFPKKELPWFIREKLAKEQSR